MIPLVKKHVMCSSSWLQGGDEAKIYPACAETMSQESPDDGHLKKGVISWPPRVVYISLESLTYRFQYRVQNVWRTEICLLNSHRYPNS